LSVEAIDAVIRPGPGDLAPWRHRDFHKRLWSDCRHRSYPDSEERYLDRPFAQRSSGCNRDLVCQI